MTIKLNIDNFLLINGQDIPLLDSNIIIHQPTIKEIANVFLTEMNFFTGYEFMFFSKDKLTQQEINILQNISDFDILLMLLNSINESQMKEQLQCFENFLSLIFKDYKIQIEEEHILLKKDKHIYMIKEQEFKEIQKIVKQLFPFNFKNGKGVDDYNPQGKRAQHIAEKLKKAKEKLLKESKENGINFFERYISILSIGLNIPIFYFQKYTVYQLLTVFERYQKKEVYDVHLKAQLAGATGNDEVDHWMM